MGTSNTGWSDGRRYVSATLAGFGALERRGRGAGLERGAGLRRPVAPFPRPVVACVARGPLSAWSRCAARGSGRPATGSSRVRPAGGPINRSAQWPAPMLLAAANPGYVGPQVDTAEPFDAHPSVDRAWVPWIPRRWSAPAAANGRPTARSCCWQQRATRLELAAPAASDQSAPTGPPAARPAIRQAIPIGPPGLRWMSRTLRYHARGPVAQRQSRRLLISRSWVQVPPGSPSQALPCRGPAACPRRTPTRRRGPR